MSKVVIEVRGGNVVDVYTDSEEIEYCIIDHDNIADGDPAKQEFETMAMDNKRMQAIEDGKYPESTDHPDYVAGKFVCRICGGEMQMTEETQEYFSADKDTGKFPPSDHADQDVTDRRVYCKNDHAGDETGWQVEVDDYGIAQLVNVG